MNAKESLPNLTPQLQQLEQERLDVLKNNANDIMVATLGVILGTVAYCLVRNALHPNEVVVSSVFGSLFFLSIFAAIIVYQLQKKRLANYQINAKSIIVTELIGGIHPGLKYAAQGNMHRVEFEASGIFYENLSRFNCEDAITGSIDGVSFRLSEIKAEHRVGKNSYATHFHGPFMIIKLPRYFSGETYVLPIQYKETFTNWISRKFWGRGRVGTKLNFNDYNFNRMFRVISNDPKGASRMLTENFRARIMNLGNNAYVSFIGNNLYVALDDRRDYLPIDIHTSLLKEGLVKSMKEELELLLELVKDLELKNISKTT